MSHRLWLFELKKPLGVVAWAFTWAGIIFDIFLSESFLLRKNLHQKNRIKIVNPGIEPTHGSFRCALFEPLTIVQ